MPTYLQRDPPASEHKLLEGAALAYAHSAAESVYRGWLYNPRPQLAVHEEARALGGAHVFRPIPEHVFRTGMHRCVKLQPCPVPGDAVQKLEDEVSPCVNLNQIGKMVDYRTQKCMCSFLIGPYQVLPDPFRTYGRWVAVSMLHCGSGGSILRKG